MPREPIYPLPEDERLRRLAAAGLDSDMLPRTLTPNERTAAMDPGLPASPTGTPFVPATGLLLKVAALVVAVAGVVAVSDFFPSTTIDEKVAGAIVTLGAILGIASPGVRRQP